MEIVEIKIEEYIEKGLKDLLDKRRSAEFKPEPIIVQPVKAEKLSMAKENVRHFDEKSCSIEVSPACPISASDINADSELRETLTECDLSRFIEKDFKGRFSYEELKKCQSCPARVTKFLHLLSRILKTN